MFALYLMKNCSNYNSLSNKLFWGVYLINVISRVGYGKANFTKPSCEVYGLRCRFVFVFGKYLILALYVEYLLMGTKGLNSRILVSRIGVVDRIYSTVKIVRLQKRKWRLVWGLDRFTVLQILLKHTEDKCLASRIFFESQHFLQAWLKDWKKLLCFILTTYYSGCRARGWLVRGIYNNWP